MTDPVDINRVPKLNLGLQETDEVFITRQGSGPYRVPASSFPWEQKGDKGDPGGSWAPVLSLVTDGARRVHRIVGWVGGTGVEPTTTGYIGAAGIVSNIAEAVDLRGLQGTAGWAPVLALVADGDRRVHQVIDWTGGAGPKPGGGWYVGATGLVELIQDAVNVRGAAGGVGWSPVLSIVADGERRVQRVTDWTGGAGTKPTALGYIGSAGIVATAAEAVDVRGAPGSASWAPVLSIVSDGERRVQRVVDWTGGAGTKPTLVGYIGPDGIVATPADAVDVRGVQGSGGWYPVLSIVADGERRVQRVTDWAGGAGTKPSQVGYIGSAGIVATAAEAVDVRGSGVVSGERILAALNVSSKQVSDDISHRVSGYANRLGNIGTRIFGGRSGGFTTSPNGTTFHVLMALASKFDAVRVIVANANMGGTLTIDRIALSLPSSMLTDSLINNSGATHAALAFGGSPGVTIPAAPGLNRRAYAVTDWLYNVQAKDRVDGGTLPLLAVRAYVSAASAALTIMGLPAVSLANWRSHPSGRVWVMRKHDGDAVTTPSALTSTVDINQSVIVGVQYLARGKVLTVMAQGDSIMEGQGTYLSEGYILPAALQLQSEIGVPVEVAQCSWAGTSGDTFVPRTEDLFAAGIVPDVLVQAIASPNGYTTAISTAARDAARALLPRLLKLTTDNRVRPVLVTWMPADAKAWGADDIRRRELNDDVLSWAGVSVCDASAALSGVQDANGKTLMLAGTSNEVPPLHPNDYGNSLIAPLCAAAIRKALI